MDKVNLALALAVRENRLRAKLSIHRLSKISGVTERTLRCIESGETELDLLTLIVLARYFGKAPSEVLIEAEVYEHTSFVHDTLPCKLRVQQQFVRMERQHQLLGLQRANLTRQIMGMQSDVFGILTSVRVAHLQELQNRVARNDELVLSRKTQLQTARKWCDENELFSLARRASCS